jgi:putative MATE family efflux protein
MMIFTSIYGVIDGFIISNVIGKTPFAALNLIMPLYIGLGTIGFMVGTGGAALVSKTLGEGNKEKANQLFTMFVCLAAIGGICFTVLGELVIRNIAVVMGATGQLLEESLVYGRILLLFLPAFILQCMFQSLFPTAEKPKLGSLLVIGTGILQTVLALTFVVVLKWGLAGAALALGCSQAIAGFVPVIYFIRKNSSLLRLTKPTFNGKDILKVCTNGSSEMVANLSGSLVGTLYNIQLLRLIGENGVAAYGVVMYINFIFISLLYGYSIASAPIIGYHYGAKNLPELKNLFSKSLKIMCVAGAAMALLAIIFAEPLSFVFVGYDRELLALSVYVFRIYAISFLMLGVNLFGSAFFTALNNGLVSAFIAFVRTFVFQILAVMLFPVVFGTNGIWFSVVIAEILALVVTIGCFVKNKKRYHYV